MDLQYRVCKNIKQLTYDHKEMTMKYNVFLQYLGFIMAMNSSCLYAMEDLEMITIEYNVDAEHYVPTKKSSYKERAVTHTTVTEKTDPSLFKLLRENEKLVRCIQGLEKGPQGGFITVEGDLSSNPSIVEWVDTNALVFCIKQYKERCGKEPLVLGIPSIAHRSVFALYWERNSILAKINHLMFLGAIISVLLWFRASHGV